MDRTAHCEIKRTYRRGRSAAIAAALAASQIATFADVLAAPPMYASRGLAPFEIVDRVIYVRGTVNGSRPLWLLISSGSGGSAIDTAVAKELGLAPNSGTAISRPVTAAIGGAEVAMQKLSVIDLSSAEDQAGHEIDAVIGYELFKRYVVDIDYYGAILRLHEPVNYRPDLRATALPIRVSNRRAFLQAEVKLAGRDSFTREYRIDTGIGGALIDEEIKLASSPKLEIVGEDRGQRFSITLTRTEAVKLGPYSFPGANGISGDTAIGGELLRRFRTVLDYTKGQIYFLPNRHFGDRFCFEMLGAELSTARADHGLRIDAIYKGSTAEKADLKVGDILTAIDGRSTLDIPLGQVRMMTGQQNAYVLTVRRGAATREVPVTLNASL